MLANAEDISFDQVLWIYRIDIISAPLALCMLMVFMSFSTTSINMVMSSMMEYWGCDIVGRLSVS